MNGESSCQDRISTPVRNKLLSRTILLIALTLALALGAAGETNPTEAAPNAQSKVVTLGAFSLDVHQTADRLCVGDKSGILVKLRRAVTTQSQGRTKKGSMGVARQFISAFPEAGGIVTVDGGSTEVTAGSGRGLGKGNAMFIIRAMKPGKTQVRFEANGNPQGPAALNTDLVGLAEETIPVEVEECNEYEVTVVVSLTERGVRQGSFTTFLGPVRLKRSETSGDFEGDGSFSPVIATFRSIDGCISHLNFTPSSTHIIGHLENEKLTLTFKDPPEKWAGDITCPHGGSASATIFYQGLFLRGFQGKSFPEDGGFMPYRGRGEDGSEISLTLSVKPIKTR